MPLYRIRSYIDVSFSLEWQGRHSCHRNMDILWEYILRQNQPHKGKNIQKEHGDENYQQR